MDTLQHPRIRVGIGGWTYEPWRSNFYPAGLPHAQELRFASQQLSAIEVNGTFYRTPGRDSFARWRDETADDCVLSFKAPRFATTRRVLAEAGPAIERFIGSGLTLLGARLGPILWQLPPSKAFDADDLEAFLRLLPRRADGLALRHVLEVPHASFAVPEYLALARAQGVGTVFSDTGAPSAFADITGDVVYLRIKRAVAELPLGYTPEALDAIAACAQVWAQGGEPAGVPRVEQPRAAGPREVFVFFIAAAKEHNPAAAMALLQRLGR